MTKAGKVTVPIKKILTQKFYENLKVQFKKAECTTGVLA